MTVLDELQDDNMYGMDVVFTNIGHTETYISDWNFYLKNDSGNAHKVDGWKTEGESGTILPSEEARGRVFLSR